MSWWHYVGGCWCGYWCNFGASRRNLSRTATSLLRLKGGCQLSVSHTQRHHKRPTPTRLMIKEDEQRRTKSNTQISAMERTMIQTLWLVMIMWAMMVKIQPMLAKMAGTPNNTNVYHHRWVWWCYWDLELETKVETWECWPALSLSICWGYVDLFYATRV